MIFTKCKIIDICNIYQPHTISTKEMVDGGKYNVYGANGIIGKYDKYNHEESEVVMACRGATCGALNITEPFSWINGNAMVIKPNGNIPILQKYLYYFLLFSNKDSIITGTAQPQITRSNMSDFSIYLCDIDTQQRIVTKIEELFSKLDKGVEELNKIKEQLKIYCQAVLKETLESNKSNHRIEDVVISFQNGIAKRSGKDGKEILVLRLADVSNNSVIVSNDMRRILLSEEEQKTYVLDKDDAIIIRVNGSPDRVGRMILVDRGNTYAFCDHLIRCKFNGKIVLPKYVKYCMDASACRKYIKENMVSTAGQNTISQSTIKNCPIFVPDIKEQETLVKQIESRLSVCDKIEQTVDESLQKAESLRQSILKQAFEGKLV